MPANNFNTEWRKVASVIYRKPVDSKILGSVEIDVTALESFVSLKRQEGLKITLTHIFVLAIARALREEVPELNCFIRRGRVVHRSSVDATVSVLLREDQMSSVRIDGVDTLSLEGLAAVMNEKVKELRGGLESAAMRKKGGVARIPWPLRGWAMRLLRFLTIELGITVLGMSAGNYGSFVLSNIGVLGLDTGYPALFPISNVSIVIIQGGVSLKPMVVDGAIVPRRVISLSVALDHRVVDAWQGGKLFRYVKNVVKNPQVLETKPQQTVSAG